MDIQQISQLTNVGQQSSSLGAFSKTSAPAEIAKPSAPTIEVPSTAVQASARPLESGQLKQALDNVNSFVQKISPELNFTMDEDTGIRVVKVIDQATKEVIRQFPSEEILAIAKSLDTLQGLLVKQKV